jgi:release factor glutamine methyltransferase
VWSSFYHDHELSLQDVYPGLNKSIFLRDLFDILKFRTNNSLINLEHSSLSLSPLMTKQLQDQFLSGVPFAYLMGFSEFYYQQFYVNEHVLIPRPETEFMVDLIVQEFKGKAQNILDIGTGSGAIILSLLYSGVGNKGLGVDLSQEALKVAEINTHRQRLENKVTFSISDRLENVEGIFDLIVSNPPYIKSTLHRKLVHQSVDKHEPHQALYLPDEDYDLWFQKFFLGIRSHLDGVFIMEGHELELEEQAKVLESLGFKSVRVIKDLTGVNRFLRAEINLK